jgi:hypothetical protein
MPSYDPSRVLRDYALEPLRRELCASGSRTLVVTNGIGLAALAASTKPCDGVWIEAESLDGIELPALAASVVRALRPGGRLVCVVPGELRTGIDGGPRQLAFSAWRQAFEPAVEWRRSRAFGVLVPEPSAWPQLRPLTVGLLAMGEHVVGGWPVVRALGTRVVHQGVRR